MASMQDIQAALSGFPRVLAWTNFHPVPNSPMPPHQALTSAGWAWTHSGVHLVNGEYRVNNPRVTVSLNHASWATPAAVASATLLVHEQGHYDISGLVARDVVQQLLDWSLDATVAAAARGSGNNAQQHLHHATAEATRDINRFVAEANALMARLQTNPVTHADGLYDVQTNHSLNTASQAAWNTRFTRLKTGNEMFLLWLAMEGVI